MRGGRAARMLATTLVVVATTFGLVAPAAHADPGDAAVQKLAACLTNQQEGDLLVLIDQSGSLKQTDPGNVRVKAVQYLLDQLAQNLGGITLNVAIAGFDADYQRTAAWQVLGGSSLPGLTSSVESYAKRNDGLDTDYTNALAGARDELRSRNKDGRRCQSLVFVTDGQFDIEARRSDASRQRYPHEKPYAPGVALTNDAGAAKAESLGKSALCREGGVADQLRNTGTLTLAIGLGSSDFSLMQAVATGSSPGVNCGRPQTGPVGVFKRAADVDDLLFDIDRFISLGGSGPSTTSRPICQFRACSQTHDIVLDSSLRYVHVLAEADVPGVTVLLRPPSVTGAATFRYGATPLPTSVAGQVLSGRWITPRTMEFTLTQKAAPTWQGRWSVVFVDPAGSSPGKTAKTSIHIKGDLVPVLANKDGLELRSNTPAKLVLGLQSLATKKAVLPTEVLGTAIVTATLTTADGRSLPIASNAAPAKLSQGFPLDMKGVAPGAAILELSLAVTTAPVRDAGGRVTIPGTSLDPQLVEVPLNVLVPFDFPTITSHASFGSATGTGPLHASYRVTGPGCVWLDGPVITGSPDGGGTVEAKPGADSSASTCLVVKKGARADLPVSLDLTKAGNGSADGTFAAHLAPIGSPDQQVTTKVAFHGQFTKPLNVEKFGVAFALAMVLGLGLPLAFLYLLRWATALIPAKAMQTGIVRIDVSAEGVTRDTGAPLALVDTDTSILTVPKKTRSLSPTSGVTLSTSSPLNPFASAFTRVTAAGWAPVTSTGGDRLPLAVQGTWVALLVEPVRQEVDLLLLLPPNVTPAQLSTMTEDIQRGLPREVVRLRAEAGVAPVPVPVNEGFAGSYGGSTSGGFAEPLSSGSTYTPSPTGAAPPPPSTPDKPPPGSDPAPPPSEGDSWW